MGWEEVIKSNRLLLEYDDAKKRVAQEVEDLIEHPDYDLEETIFKIDKQLYRSNETDFLDEFAKKILRGEIYHIEPGHGGGIFHYIEGEKYEGELTDSLLTDATELLNETWELFRAIYMDMANFKSRRFLGEIAETFGVVLETSPHNKFVLFRHRGLGFELHQGGISIHIPRINKEINICVVDENSLPIGDFYASMLGLIVAKPEELDVVNFGIQLALIIKGYEHINWNAVWGDEIAIFTPFNRANYENTEFINFIARLKKDNVNSDAPDILSEIEDALVNCFGSTRGFF